MTLRHRLLLLYGIVAVLSMATVGVALFELARARQVFGSLQLWHDIVLTAEKLKSGFPPGPEMGETDAFHTIIGNQYGKLGTASAYLDTERVRGTLNALNHRYREWAGAGPAATPEQSAAVRVALNRYAELVDDELAKLNRRADQHRRSKVLLVVVAAMIVGHVAVLSALLRRWLLHPMEQLNRQVEALGRDEPPADPLLRQPREMANLAVALDRARQSLRALRERLLETQRLTAIGQLAAQLAHNLRNPLASIRAAAQVTARQEVAESTRERMHEIINSVDRLNQWIAGLMEVARREPTPAPPGDVVPTLYRTRDALSAELAAKDLTLEIDAPVNGLICLHDPATLEHALIAMVINSIEASPLGASITIRCERLPTNGCGSLCRIELRDHGPGFPVEPPERVFDFAVSTKHQGMGLGLALARQGLQRQGGSMRIENHPEGGALAYIELPVEPVEPVRCQNVREPASLQTENLQLRT